MFFAFSLQFLELLVDTVFPVTPQPAVPLPALPSTSQLSSQTSFWHITRTNPCNIPFDPPPPEPYRLPIRHLEKRKLLPLPPPPTSTPPPDLNPTPPPSPISTAGIMQSFVDVSAGTTGKHPLPPPGCSEQEERVDCLAHKSQNPHPQGFAL
ncbi:hypothetical protein PCANC_22473 [Puccinia coronata f. sp. avenae]|uniref:Uncharacterized protein n=1 Tax=Puccinia coronata f. sp. avenae TaxID=200324 RepID=A0A2N5SA09_9BASI|nr:hypothetical protein PCANC_22473 [Puccinia coronata f. sp. avenae]